MENVIITSNDFTAEIEPKVYNNKRVVTLDDIDKVHNRKSGTARRNFNQNKKRFIENEDYFTITYDELRTNFVRNSEEDFSSKRGNPNIEVVLLTESGYLMIVKSFKDDLSWDVQRKLVNSYFKLQQTAPKKKPLKVNPSQNKNYKSYLGDFSYDNIPDRPLRWTERNRRDINNICWHNDWSLNDFYNFILDCLYKYYDLKNLIAVYYEIEDRPPQYPIDLVDYFPELTDLADKFLIGLKTKMNKEKQEKN